MLQKSRLALKSARPVLLSLLCWKFILGEWISKLIIRKAILALRNVIYSLQDNLIGKLQGLVTLQSRHRLTGGFTRFSLDLAKRPVYLVISMCIALAEKLLYTYSWSYP